MMEELHEKSKGGGKIMEEKAHAKSPSQPSASQILSVTLVAVRESDGQGFPLGEPEL